MKKLVCIIMCLSFLVCTTACKNNNDKNTSTASSNLTSSNTNPTTESIEVSTTTSDASSNQSSGSSNVLQMLYGFSNIEKIECFCIKSTPNSDLIYAVSKIITDSGEINDLKLEITCEEKSIIAENNVITIPYSYAKNHSSVKLTALHKEIGATCDFTINFDKEWDLIFEDEFNGTELDTTVWEHRPEYLRDKGYVNYWSKELTFLDGKGNLVSRATPGKKTVDGKEVDAYLSGAVGTKGLFSSSYGYYETRAKLHHKTGMWGAFWLVCGDMGDKDVPSDNSSTNGCEIDVFESLYNHGGVTQNLHWDGFTGHTCSAPSNGYVTYIDTFDEQYHTFAVSWTPNEYVFLVDNVVTRRINSEVANGICNQDGHMLITTECGTWAGDWVLDEGEYSDMLVDYVRVYSLPN